MLKYFDCMAKKIFISEEQYQKLQNYIKEDGEKTLEIPVDVDNGNVEDAINNAKENITNVLGQSVANKTNFTLKGSALEGKKFSKKTIEESRINRIKTEGKVYSKREFIKTLLNNE